MAKCIYNLYGKIFNSELELDEFLTDYLDYLKDNKISDVVFSKKQDRLLNITKKKLLDAHDKASEIRSIKLKIGELKRKKGHIDEDQVNLVRPYLAVTKALGLLHQVVDSKKLLAPSMQMDTYEKELIEGTGKSSWGVFGQTINPDFAALLNPSDPESLIEKSAKWTYPKDAVEMHETFNKLKTIWEQVAQKGTAIHKVFELCWNAYNDDLLQAREASDIDIDSILNDADVKGLLTRDNVLLIIEHWAKLREQLTDKFGEDMVVLPEYVITADTTECFENSNEPIKLIGTIDLLILSKNRDGSVSAHIYDYKTSYKDYNKWLAPKILSIKYLTGLYARAIDQIIGSTPNVHSEEFGIINLKIDDYDSASGRVGNIKFDERSPIKRFDIGSDMLPGTRIRTNIDGIIKVEAKLRISSTEFNSYMQENYRKLFPGYKQAEVLTDVALKSLEKEILHDSTAEPGKLWFLRDPAKWDSVKYFDSEADAIAYLPEYHKALLKKNLENINYYKQSIKRALKNHDPNELPAFSSRISGSNPGWFNKYFSLYCDGDWELVTEGVDDLESLNILVLKNITEGLDPYYTFILLDPINLREKVQFKKGDSIVSALVDDITVKLKGVLPLEGNVGNIDLMKAALAINKVWPNLAEDGHMRLGDIQVVNPRLLLGIHTSLKQIIDNFNILAEYGEIQENNFVNTHIQTMSAIELARSTLLALASKEENYGKFNKILSKYEIEDSFVIDTLEDLLQLKADLEANFGGLSGDIDLVDWYSEEGRLYGYVVRAINQLQGSFFTLNLQRHGTWYYLYNNPENMDKVVLQLRQLAENYFITYKDEMIKFANEERVLRQKLWKSKGFGATKRMATGETFIFNNMYANDEDYKGTFRFKNPWDYSNNLTTGEREYLLWAIVKINQLKDSNLTEADIKSMAENPLSTVLEVPLKQATSTGKIANSKGKGVISWFKRLVEWWKHPVENVNRQLTDTLSKEDAELAEHNAEMFHIYDIFSKSDDPAARNELLTEHEIAYFDHDLATVSYMYASAKIRKRLLDGPDGNSGYLGILKATLAETVFEASLLNSTEEIVELEKYIKDWVKNKVLNLSIVPQEYRLLYNIISKGKTAATYASLGFSLKAFNFQILEGAWKNFSRAGFRPVGENLFGLNELKKAMSWIIGDTPNHFNIVSLGELINEQYAINDMDVNVFAQRLREGQLPVSFTSKMMWLTSAPDYFNRMAVFIAQMIKDGCFKAHTLDGLTMKYDFTKDERFIPFITNDKDNPDYGKSKQLYITMMELFKKEGYSNLRFDPSKDYDPEYDSPIPKAYTNILQRSLKSFADQLYGYYNHEDQWMLKSTLLGSTITLFRTYWSSLYNRWLGKGDVYMLGRFEQAVDKDGNKIFKKFIFDDAGRLIRTELTTEDTGEPFIVWKGSFLEGFLRTMIDCVRYIYKGRGENETIKQRAIEFMHGHGNADVARVRITNMLLMAHDLAIWSLIGMLLGWFLTGLLKAQEKEDKNAELGFADMTVRNAEDIIVSSLIASTQDLGALKDLISPMTDWTPPALRFAKNFTRDVMGIFSGDRNLVDAAVANLGVLRQTKHYYYNASLYYDELLEDDE